MRVLLADQHPEIRLALAILLGKEPGVTVVGSVSEAEGLVALARITQPDIIILDSQLPGSPTIDVMTALRHFNQELKILLLGDLPASFTQTIKTSAVISKNDSPDVLLQKFRQITAGCPAETESD